MPNDRLRACESSFRALHGQPWRFEYWRGLDHLLDDFPSAEITARRSRINEHFARINEIVKNPSRQKAFEADIIRLVALHNCGGIYVDHDMYCLRPLDGLLNEDCILMEFRPGNVGEGILGFRGGDERLLKILDHVLDDSIRRICGLQIGPMARHNGWKSFAPEYFCPHPRMNIQQEDRYKTTDNTYMIHLWSDHEYDMKLLEEMQRKANARQPQPVLSI